MAQPKALLDTDTLSAVLRGTPFAVARSREYLAEHGAFAFDRFCETCLVLPLTDEIVVKAAEIYATLKKRGQPTGDADILIGASALTHGFGVVTNNEAHFGRIEGLRVENWLKP